MCFVHGVCIHLHSRGSMIINRIQLELIHDTLLAPPPTTPISMNKMTGINLAHLVFTLALIQGGEVNQ